MLQTTKDIVRLSISIVPGIIDEEDELGERKVSLILSDDEEDTKTAKAEAVLQDSNAISQLLTHIPDVVINYNQKVLMPAKKECIGVTMFADISGFTALCEKYADMVTKDSACGTDKLTATLNNYIGKIVDCIIKDGGDVLKFAGDAILASWVFSHSGHNVKTVLTKAIRCGLAIQDKCDNQMTEVGVLLRVKIAMAIGSMIITFVGTKESKQFDLSGSAIDEVGAAEKHANPSDVILTNLAWSNCDQDIFKADKLDDVNLYKVSENKRIIETQRVSQGLAVALPGIFSEMKGGGFTPTKKLIICPELDKLIEECPTCHLGLPKALLPDTDDIDVRGGFGNSKFPGRNERRPDKERRFDRQRMSFNLDADQVQDLRAYVATPVLDKLDHGQDLEWLSEMRQVSVLFINMKLPDGVDDAARALQKAFEVIYEAVLKYQGNLNKVFSFDKGCTFVVIFGLPGGKHEDDGYRSLKAGHMIYESLHAVAEITDESIGVTTGRAFCGVVGHKDRHEYTVIGRKVNMAARLMTNYPGKLSCDPDTFEAAKMKLKRSDFVTLPFKVLKGIKDPGIIREYNPSSSTQEEIKDFEYPILGRESEINEFSDVLKNLQTHKHTAANIIIIEGEAGIGKTRLLEEFMDMVEDQHLRLNYLELDSSQSMTPYYVVGSFISTLLNIEHCRCSSEKEHILFDIVQDTEMREDLCFLNDLLGTEILPTKKFNQMEEEQRNAHFHNILLHIVNKVTQKCASVFVIDNAQFVDAESWEFFHDFVTGSNAVLVLAMRPFSSTSNQAPCQAAIKILQHIKTKRIFLDSLPLHVMSDLACQMLQVYRIPKRLDEVLRSRSNGIPSWCEQLVKELLTTNVIQTGPSDAFDLENEIHDSSADLDASTSTGCSSPFQSLESPALASRRRWSMTRQMITMLKRASNAFSASQADSETVGDGSRRNSEQGLPIGNRRCSVDSESSEKSYKSPFEFMQRTRRMSIESAKSIRLNLERDDTLYPVVEQTDEAFEENIVKTPESNHDSVHRRESSATPRRMSSCVTKSTSNYICANQGSVPDDIENICVITPGMKIDDSIVPNTVNDVVVARLDRMSPNEQLILKCASVLGMNFTRELLSAIVPRKTASVLDTTLYRLSKERLLECGSLALSQSQQHNNNNRELSGRSSHHHHRQDQKPKNQVLCGCYANEGSQTINLAQTARQSGGKKKLCLYFHFSNTLIREAAYDLWLEDQRHALHERAAMFLETQMHLCKSCGGTSFVPGIKSKTAYRRNPMIRDLGDVSANVERKRAQAAAKATSAGHQNGTTFRKILIGNNKVNMEREEIQNETGYYPKQKQAGNRGDGIGRALVDMAGMITKGVVHEEQSDNKFKSLAGKIMKRKNSVAPDKEAAARAVVAEFRKLVMTPDKNKQSGNLRKLNEPTAQNRSDQSRSKKVDVSECQCYQVMSVIFPQLVFHWKAAKNNLKTFNYLIESAAALIAIHSNIQALSYLTEVETMINEADANCDDDSMFFVSTEDKARVEFLKGQALMNMNRIDEAIKHFILSLKQLGNSHPKSKLGTIMRTLSAYMTQVLHRKMPDTFKERGEDSSRLLIEEARCLTHLARAYHMKHDLKRSYMVALEQLNAAEEAEEDWVELITAHSNMIECCQLTKRTKLGRIYEEIALAKMKQEFKSIEELLAAVQLHENIMAFRLYEGQILSSINAGCEALHLANNVNDLRTKIDVIPLLSQALLLLSRVQACHEVLHELRRAALDLDDIHGKSMYYCGCMELMLEQGRPIESFKKCIEFSRKIVNEPSLSSDVLPRFYLSISVAMMFARQRNWPLAFSFYNTALEFEPEYCDMFLYCRAYARVVEFNLLSFKENRQDESTKSYCKEVLKKFKSITQRHSVLLPRLYHLQAYYAYLRGKASRAKLLIENCLIASRSIEPMFEVDWAMSSRNHWFSNENLSTFGEDYDGKSKYVLPRY